MEKYLYLILIGLHIFALWPITLFYCRTKKKRKTRVVGKSCESLLIDPNKQR
uniref:Uncharacterized protein n=1 Tax=Panagrolaimus sp. PS1159 TaxID=55785 RepID=A0AC35GLZ9_9BILA